MRYLMVAVGAFFVPWRLSAQTSTITFTLSTADLTRVVNALSVRYGYQAKLPNGSANPQTAGEFVRLRIAQWISSEVQQHELAIAKSTVTVTTVSIS